MPSRTVREGSLGLFILIGVAVFGGILLWLRGFKGQGYEFTVELDDASGVRVGSPVYYRGVSVGRVTDLKPTGNEVEMEVEITTPDLRIPRDVRIETTRYGFIGEASVQIVPLQPLTSAAASIDPRSSKCDPKQIICDKIRVPGKSGTSFLSSTARLAELYGDPKFYSNFSASAQNFAIASARINQLLPEVSRLVKSLPQELQQLSKNSTALIQTADNSLAEVTRQIVTTTEQFNLTARTINQLASNSNQLLIENRSNITKTLTSVSNTSNELGQLASDLKVTVTKVNSALSSAQTEKVVQNLEVVSTNLRDLSSRLNDPANLLVVQQTLDSARAMFENAQKITSDLDELTGDPKFRNNVRKLIDGLSNLVSSTQQLEQQVKTAQVLESVKQQLQQQAETIQRLEPEKAVSHDPPPLPIAPESKKPSDPTPHLSHKQ